MRDSTEAEKMACTWFGEILSCCSLALLLGPAWVLLKYVMQTIFSGSVQGQAKERELSLVRELPLWLIGYASAAQVSG